MPAVGNREFNRHQALTPAFQLVKIRIDLHLHGTVLRLLERGRRKRIRQHGLKRLLLDAF